MTEPGYRPIADYGLVGDCHGCALVAATGDMDALDRKVIVKQLRFVRYSPARKIINFQGEAERHPGSGPVDGNERQPLAAE